MRRSILAGFLASIACATAAELPQAAGGAVQTGDNLCAEVETMAARAQQGLAAAQVYLALRHERGACGLKKDYVKAAAWYFKSLSGRKSF